MREQRKTMCGLPCTDQGRESKTVPYDKITDCDVKEPAGTACCCCIPPLGGLWRCYEFEMVTKVLT